MTVLGADLQAAPVSRWFRGSPHFHTTQSDGRKPLEAMVTWYQAHGYDFGVETDHWKVPEPAMLAAARARVGPDFLIIPGEEITVPGAPHIGALNITTSIDHIVGPTMADTLFSNVALIRAQERNGGPKALAVIHHPNRGWAIGPADVIAATNADLIEVFNNCTYNLNEGDATHPSTERLWDIANAARIKKLHLRPLFAQASDDAIDCLGGPGQPFMDTQAGNGWIMVRAASLSGDRIIEAMSRGDFYASTGVNLKQASFDTITRELVVEVDPAAGRQYVIEFIGTLRQTDVESGAKDAPATDSYSAAIGKSLKTVPGTRALYRLNGSELSVRAVIRSDRRVWETGGRTHDETAWTQPVGWPAK
jgi:hypothetical protein